MTMLAENQRPTRDYELSRGESEVLRLLSEGMTDEQIGRELRMPVHTVTERVRRALQQMGTRSRTEAAIHVLRASILGQLRG